YAVFTDEKVLVTVNLYPEFQYGDFVSVKGELQSPKNFDDFDYINYLAKDGIFSLAYYPKISKIMAKAFLSEPTSKPESLKISLFKNIFRIKKVFKESIERTKAEPNAALINGILLGSRENIPQDLKEAFNKTGTTHILAISGYNITIVGLYISFLFMFFVRRQTAFWFTVLGIIIFTILTGASASVIRAAIMGILVLLAYREGRFNNMANSIVFAGLVMIILNPKVLRFDIGFQLSFLATLGLVYFTPFLSEKLKRVPEFWNFKESFIATLSAQAMVLPVILYNFGSFSLVSLPANVLILPIVPITMFFGFLAGVSGLIWLRLGEAIGLIAWLLSEYEILIVRAFSSIL
ncbi:MAG: ComEC/Rec2 family competence protein, partial [Parcubacteria group bacterium]|nr:ComEC/Rec2 family competence protein [Parcubacteria group bacterium]